MKINNSEPCLCGSGKPFKSCCKGKIYTNRNVYREDVLKNPNRINHMLQQKLKSTDFKICFHPDKVSCKFPIKNAHTLQNNGILSIIAENDHVMVTNLFSKIREGFVTHRLSKNEATTFYGFCEYHDSVIFKEIETVPYDNQIKQNFLYAYRTCAQEFHKKIRQVKAIQGCFKDNPSIVFMEGFVESYRNMMLSYSDVNEYMNIFNNSFVNNDFDILENYVFEFKERYDFAVSTTFNPTCDLNGKQINDIYSTDKERLKGVFLSVLPTQDRTYMILSCLKEDHKSLEAYFNQIKALDENNLKTFLNNVLPTFSENIVLSPRLWNKWTNFSKREYEKIVTGEIGEFNKLLSNELPYNSIEEFISGIQVKNGINNMLAIQKYNLFKI
mgnify:CR=1 FL=1